MQLDWKSNWSPPEAARSLHSIFQPGSESSPVTKIIYFDVQKMLLCAGFRASHAVCWSQIEDHIVKNLILINCKQQGHNSTCCSMMSLLITMISLNMLACSSNVAWSTTNKPFDRQLSVSKKSLLRRKFATPTLPELQLSNLCDNWVILKDFPLCGN